MVAAQPAPAPPAAFRSLELPALDGVPLTARHFAPSLPARGAALIVPAMGVPQSFYEAFATWLAGDLHVVTFDYRGTGLSRRGSLRGLRADIFDWARLDATA